MKTIDFHETVGMAVGALKANKLRAFLTLLGVGIGVFSFIGVMTGISVLQDTIESSFNVLGSNTLAVQKYPAMQHGPEARMKYRNRKDITVEQGLYIRRNSKLASHVSVAVGQFGGTMQYRDKKTNPNISVKGGTPDLLYTSNLTIGEGRMFTEQDMEFARNVIVAGPAATKMLFTNEDPLNKSVRLDGKSYTIIGITEEKGGLFGSNADNFVLVPLTTFESAYGKARQVGLLAQAPSQSSYEAMTDEVIGLLRNIRRVPPGDENDFEIMTNESLIAQVNDLTFTIRAGTGAVSAIALFAAGIGIMNIMLVSVTERTREIGIRKALGATKKSILRQFLIEAVVICEIGGLAGIAMGLGGGNIVALMLKLPPVLPIGWAVVGLVVTSVIGIIFGVYPAWKAANLDPIDALRYE